jgi:hypothetical protein
MVGLGACGESLDERQWSVDIVNHTDSSINVRYDLYERFPLWTDFAQEETIPANDTKHISWLDPNYDTYIHVTYMGKTITYYIKGWDGVINVYMTDFQ